MRRVLRIWLIEGGAFDALSARAFDDFSNGLQFEVRCHGWSLAADETFLGDEVLASGGEAVGEEGLDAHACLRKSGGVLVAPVRLLYVFS